MLVAASMVRNGLRVCGSGSGLTPARLDVTDRDCTGAVLSSSQAQDPPMQSSSES